MNQNSDIKVTSDPDDDSVLHVSFTLRPNYSIKGKMGFLTKNGSFMSMDMLRKSIEKTKSADQIFSIGTKLE